MKNSRLLGCTLVIAALILIHMLYFGAFNMAYRISGPSRVVITWPSSWGCDEFNEAYTVVQVSPANSFIRFFHSNENLIVPYPTGRYRDTTRFHKYYDHLIKSGQEDTVIVSGYFGEIMSVGEGGAYGGGGMFACDPIPYFRVQNIYTKEGKLLKHFSVAK